MTDVVGTREERKTKKNTMEYIRVRKIAEMKILKKCEKIKVSSCRSTGVQLMETTQIKCISIFKRQHF